MSKADRFSLGKPARHGASMVCYNAFPDPLRPPAPSRERYVMDTDGLVIISIYGTQPISLLFRSPAYARL